MSKTFGQQLQAHRLKSKLSQSQYAKKHTICVNSLRNWEQGRYIPRGEDALKLAKIMLQPPKITGIKE